MNETFANCKGCSIFCAEKAKNSAGAAHTAAYAAICRGAAGRKNRQPVSTRGTSTTAPEATAAETAELTITQKNTCCWPICRKPSPPAHSWPRYMSCRRRPGRQCFTDSWQRQRRTLHYRQSHQKTTAKPWQSSNICCINWQASKKISFGAAPRKSMAAENG